MSKLPTPDELGEMLQAGEITREEAIEIMDQRTREEAFNNLYNPGGQEEISGAAEAQHVKDSSGSASPPSADDLSAMRKRARIITALVIVTILMLMALAVIMKLT